MSSNLSYEHWIDMFIFALFFKRKVSKDWGAVVALGLLGCASRASSRNSREPALASSVAVEIAPPDAGPRNVATPPLATFPQQDEWWNRFDFDGDGKPDRIDTEYSGGAHCCYKLSVNLTKSGRVVDIPFELDGGYVRGLSLENPEHFNIVVGDDGVAKLRMQIEVVGLDTYSIPAEWTRAYGIRSHFIEVDLRTGAIRARDVP